VKDKSNEVHIGAQRHANFLIKASNALQHIYHESFILYSMTDKYCHVFTCICVLCKNCVDPGPQGFFTGTVI